jgi:dihydrofolate synthase/folylpolyglutamate synthase
MASPARYADLLARLDGARTLGVELGLGRVRQALAALGEPQRRFAAVQIAGTNGKGSTTVMTEALLRAAGLRTARYTSPHLCRFTERFFVDGVEADGDRLAALDGRVAATGVPLTYFEIATALAFLLFAEERVDVAVLETGLGGRLDAVTTCAPVATAITSIGIDHTGYLGDTLAAIAREKAGILKPGVPCWLGRLPLEADAEIALIAGAIGAPLRRLGTDFQPPAVPLALAGSHQRDNAALASALAHHAATPLGRTLDDATVAGALAGVTWPGRLERLDAGLLLDAAHNAEGAQSLARALGELAPGRRVVLLTSIVGDKDPDAILAALAPPATAVVATRSTNPRALAPEALAALARRHISDVTAVDDPLAALAEARHRAGPAGLVVAAGSMFLLGELRAHLLGEKVDPLPTSDPVSIRASAASESK